MNRLYDEAFLERNRLTRRKWITVSSVVLAILLLFLSIGLFLVDRTNVNWMIPSLSVIGSLIAIYGLYLVLEKLIPINRLYRHVVLMNREKPILIGEVEIEEVSSSPITLSSGVRSYEVHVMKDDGYKTYYMIEALMDKLPKEGEKVTVSVASSYIVEVSHE